MTKEKVNNINTDYAVDKQQSNTAKVHETFPLAGFKVAVVKAVKAIKQVKINISNAPPWKNPMINNKQPGLIAVQAKAKANKENTANKELTATATTVIIPVAEKPKRVYAKRVKPAVVNTSVLEVFQPKVIAIAKDADELVNTTKFELIPLLGVFYILKDTQPYLKVGNTTAIGGANVREVFGTNEATASVSVGLTQTQKGVFKVRFKKSKIVTVKL